jgi:hypothetical protein
MRQAEREVEKRKRGFPSVRMRVDETELKSSKRYETSREREVEKRKRGFPSARMRVDETLLLRVDYTQEHACLNHNCA